MRDCLALIVPITLLLTGCPSEDEGKDTEAASETAQTTMEDSTTEAPATDGASSGGGMCSELESSCNQNDPPCCDGLECHGSLIPTCITPGECLPEGAECATSEECCEGLTCDGMEVLTCSTEA